jgi:hypothetical protein
MQHPHDQPLGILPIQRVEYRYEPSYRLAEILSRIPKRAKRVAIEVSAIALLSFTLSTVLASQSDELKGFRAYFLLTAKDCAVIEVVGLSLYRLLGGINEKG